MDADVRAAGAASAADAARDELDRILASDDFASAPRAKRLLRYLVEEALAGRGGELKEYALGVAVFDRDASFDPASNPVVRVEASRLRQRLERFYLKTGRHDSVVIELPRGGYTPVFRAARAAATTVPPQSTGATVPPRVTEAAVPPRTTEAAAPPRAIEAAAPSSGAATAPPAATFVGPSLLVLPFVSSGGAAARMFADGLTLEIMASLHRFRDLGIYGRSTTLQHHDEPDALALARRLKADFVVEGTARRTARRVRVQAQVLDARDGRVLWADRYDHDLDTATIFEIEADIAAHVAAVIGNARGVLFRPELTVAMNKPLATLDAFDGLLIFYDYSADVSPERHAKARAALEHVVQIEPDASSLWAALANLHVDSYQLGFNLTGPRHEHAAAAVDAARRAVDLDPWNPSAQLALSVAAYARGDFAAFRQAGDRAIELNPNDAEVLANYGVYLTCRGEWDEGLALLDRARELNPEPPSWFWFPYARWHLEQGDFAEALEFAERAGGPDFYWTHVLRAVANVMAGNKAAAATAVQRLRATNPAFARDAREELARWYAPDEIPSLLAALQQAGLEL